MTFASRIAAVTAATVLGLCGTAPAAADPPEGRVANADAPTAVPGSYLVMLKPGVPENVITDATVTRRYDSINGYAVAMSAERARRLAADPAVVSVEADTTLSAAATQPNPPWGLDRIDQAALPLDNAYTPPNVAANVTVYVIDSGIRITHDEFATNRAVYGRNVADGTMVSDDGFGHGTHVAATIGGKTYGVAKDVTLVAVRVFDDNGEGDMSEVLDAVDWVIDDVTDNGTGPAVINMSLSSERSDPVNSAVKAATDAGIVVVASAGNKSEDACDRSPASAPEAITVGASDADDAMATFTNWGSCVDVFAPGVGVLSAINTGDSASAVKSGTSMSAPHVAGAAALYLGAHPTATPAEVRHDLVAAGTKGTVTGSRSCTTGRLLTVGLAAASPIGDDVPPAADGDLSAPGATTPGTAIPVTGAGFDPGTTVTYTMYPGATVLGTGLASATGTISDTLAVPTTTTCDVTVVATGSTQRVLSARVGIAAPAAVTPLPAPQLPITGDAAGERAGGIAATGTTIVAVGVAVMLIAGYRRRETVPGRHRVGR